MTDPTSDPEIAALAQILRAIADLDGDAKQRVLRYAAERIGLSFNPRQTTAQPTRKTAASDKAHTASGQTEYSDSAMLFEHAQPEGGPMQALVAGYWFQVCAGQSEFGGKEVNDTLKSLGYPSANITVSLGRLIKRKPALIQQVGKSGKSQQARKDYRLTSAGIKAVETMLAGEGNGKGD